MICFNINRYLRKDGKKWRTCKNNQLLIYKELPEEEAHYLIAKHYVNTRANMNKQWHAHFHYLKTIGFSKYYNKYGM
jgi:hypothetical protein